MKVSGKSVRLVLDLIAIAIFAIAVYVGLKTWEPLIIVGGLVVSLLLVTFVSISRCRCYVQKNSKELKELGLNHSWQFYCFLLGIWWGLWLPLMKKVAERRKQKLSNDSSQPSTRRNNVVKLIR